MATTTPDRAKPERKTRPKLADRQGPLRSRTASRPRAPAEPAVSSEVAEAVKRGYDIITENIRQGREAAERFREGEYSLRDAPDDIARLTARMMLLAREMSTATFDVVDRVARELGRSIAAAKDRDGSVPPFRSAEGMTAGRSAEPGRLRVTISCTGHPRAFGRPATIDRPKRELTVEGLEVGPFTSQARTSPRPPLNPTRDAAAEAAAAAAGGVAAAVSIEPAKAKRARGGSTKPEPAAADEAGIVQIDSATVTFKVDLSREGVVAVVPVPQGHAPGVYSAFVYAKEDPSPLGAITIEVLG